MPCSVCFAHGHNIRTCQFKDDSIVGVKPRNIKQKKQNKQKPVFKDEYQMYLAERDHSQINKDRKKLLENKQKQETEIRKHIERFPQDKHLIERVIDKTITDYIPGFRTIHNISSTDDNLFISNPGPNDLFTIKRFLKKRTLINRNPKPLPPTPPSRENINESYIRNYRQQLSSYNYEIKKYRKEIIPANIKSQRMNNDKIRLNRILSMFTQSYRIDQAIKNTKIIDHNHKSIILPFQKKVDGIYNNTKYNRIARLTKHYRESLQHNTTIPIDTIRVVLSFLI
jgi:hypothetical protein